MAISIKLKRRWDIYPTLQEVLAATQNLSVSPFGLTEEGLQDFRGIKLIGERAQVPLRNGYMWENISQPLHTSLSYADFTGSVWQYFAIEETDDFTPVIDHVIFDESMFQLSAYAICGNGATFLSCSFAGCKYKWGEFIGATLKDCHFTQIKKNVRLNFKRTFFLIWVKRQSFSVAPINSPHLYLQPAKLHDKKVAPFPQIA